MLVPLYFSIAHTHASITAYWKGKASLKQAVGQSVFQVGFTSIFGLYSSWVFTRQGCLWAVIVLHSQCNYIGVPMNLLNLFNS
mmetsp:Transcript_7778/g.13049  ORF Transcript_7778/g.13049 Transcript_7778/m.13049 type:complete len:83 (+) Transcript_7778:658-906(+)